MKSLAVVLNSTFRYIDDLLSKSNCYFQSYIVLIYLSALEMKVTTEYESYVSYVDILPEKDINCNITT